MGGADCGEGECVILRVLGPVLAALVVVLSAFPLLLGGLSGDVAGTAGEPEVLGEEERVEVLAPEGERGVGALAKVDTGATYTSIDDDLARELDLDLENARVVVISSALGREYRPLVEVRVRIAGRTLTSQATISERENLDNPVLIGRGDLSQFLIKIEPEGSEGARATGNGAEAPASEAFGAGAVALLVALPLAALPAVALRTLAGLPLLGLAAPVLLALAALGAAATRAGPDALPDPPFALPLLVVAVALFMERFAASAKNGGLGRAIEAACWTLLAAVAAGALLAAEPVQRSAAVSPLLTAAGAGLAAVILAVLGRRLSAQTGRSDAKRPRR